MSTKTKIINGVRFTFGKGTQDMLLNGIDHSKVMLKTIVANKDSERHAWAVVDPKTASELTSINNNIQEIIYQYPCKLYFDIDGKDTNKINLQSVKQLINKYFYNPKMAISGYENNEKNSYHIVLHELLIKDYDDLTKMKQYVKYINKIEQFNYFDETVYSKNRCMKMINQSKPNKPIQSIIENNNYYDHYITCFFNSSSKPFQFDISYDTEIINIAKLPKVDAELKAKLNNTKFKPIDIDDALKLLNLMPIDGDLHHNMVWKFANFSFHNGLSFDQFWSWCKLKRDCAERRNKYISVWNKFNKDDEIKISITYIKKILSVYYPNIHNLTDLRSKNFIESFDLPSVKIPILKLDNYETADIKNHHFDTNNKVAIFNIGMGGGKTGATVKYLKDSKKSFCLLSVRQTLSKNTFKRFQSEKVDVYNYLESKTNQDFKINNSKSLIISTESLHKLKDTSKFDILVIDEIESLFNNWDSTTHSTHITDNYYNFISLFQNCKKVILLDAFTTSRTINFLNSIGINDIVIYTSDYKKQSRKLIEYDSANKLIDNIIDDLNNNKKLFVFYPFLKNGADHIGLKDLEIYIKDKCQRKIKTISYCSISSDQTKNTLYNVDEEWSKADLILTNTSITVGVNYERHDFDKVVLFTSGYCNLARDIIQVSLRIRCPKSSTIEMYFYNKKVDEIYEYNDFYTSKYDPLYNKLIDDIVIEKKADFMASFYKLADLAGFDRSSIQAFQKRTKKIETNFNIKNGDTDFIKAVMAYDDIDSIDEQTCKNIEIEKIWKYDATMEEKFQVSRYYFERRYNMLSNEDKKFIWNNDLEKSFKNLNHPLIRSIEDDNKYGIVNIDYRNLVISDTTKNNLKSFLDINYKNEKTSIIKFINHVIGGFDLVNHNHDVAVDDEVKHLYEIHTNHHLHLEAFVDE